MRGIEELELEGPYGIGKGPFGGILDGKKTITIITTIKVIL